MLSGALSVSAQEAKTEYVPNPYWYIQIQGGAQYTLGEVDFKDLISPNVQVSVGRQFSPIFGARLSVNAWQSRAGINFNEIPTWVQGAAGTGTVTPGLVVPAGQTKVKWMYVAPGIDITFNLSNAIYGYNPNRIFNLSAFIGGGANIGWGMDKESNWENKALEVNANTLSDHYNGKKARNWDWYFNALAGVKINLGPTHTTRTIEAPKPVERIVEKVVEKIIEKPCPPVEPTNAVVVKEPFRRDVFFNINQTTVAKKELVKVQEVADYLKANPNATVEVTGYADRGTGNPTINNRLSKQRAQAVFNLLTKKHKIAASRIKVDYKGDTIQPFIRC